MPHKFDPARLARLMSAERRRELPPEPVLRRAGLAAGETVVDIGAGPGFFALPAARIVGPRGRVTGLDVAPVMITALRKNAREAGLKNIRAGRIPESSPDLPAGADLYLIVNALHEVDDPAAYLRAVRKAMGRASRLVIVDFYKKRTLHGPPFADRIPLSRLKRMLGAAGLEVKDAFRANPDEYAVVSRRKS